MVLCLIVRARRSLNVSNLSFSIAAHIPRQTYPTFAPHSPAPLPFFSYSTLSRLRGGATSLAVAVKSGGQGGWALCYVNRKGLPLAQLSSLGHHEMLANIGKQPGAFTSRREGLVGASPTTVGVAATSCPPGHAHFVASIVRRGSVRPKDSTGAAGTQSE